MRVPGRGGGHDAGFQIQVNINGGGEHRGIRRCRILASWWLREDKKAAGLSARWDNCSIRPRSMEAIRAARMPWPITSQTMAPTPGIAHGKGIEPIARHPL